LLLILKIASIMVCILAFAVCGFLISVLCMQWWIILLAEYYMMYITSCCCLGQFNILLLLWAGMPTINFWIARSLCAYKSYYCAYDNCFLIHGSLFSVLCAYILHCNFCVQLRALIT
jgi:hypothetical protein